MKTFLVFALVVLIHGTFATLIIKGPSKPVLEEEPVILECLSSESDFNVSQVHFEYFHPQYMNSWRRVWGSSMRDWYCMSGRWSDIEEENTGNLVISYPTRYSGVAFRCVSEAENVTAPDNVSEPLTFKVQYLRQPSLTREGYSSYLGLPNVLRVRLGDDVVLKCSASSSEEPNYSWQKEGNDWILPSSTLTLRKMSALDEGQYTCMVEHPSVASLSKKRTITITLLPKDAAWYETTNGRLWLMTSAVAVSLLVFIMAVSVFFCRRAKRIRTNKGPIDDHSQKKPIYKTSAESLPSTCADNQPLV
uniref:Ig-like domain-containing protein n=1 Tax=Iconisemion striatum TaxID=60296 RepID=A0A1A7WXF1_9TELE